MATVKQTAEITLVSRPYLYDFRELILPDVFDQLIVMDDFEKFGIRVLGAEAEGKPAAAAVVFLNEVGQLRILSFYVAEEFRRQGTGSEMIRDLLGIGTEEYPGADGASRFQLVMNYALPEAGRQEMEAFLRKNDFTDFTTYGRIWEVSAAAALDRLPDTGIPVLCVEQMEEAQKGELREVMRQYELQPLTESCMYAELPEEEALVMMPQILDDGAVQITSLSSAETPDPAVLKAVLRKTLLSLKQELPDFQVYADENRNVCPEVWEQLAEDGGSTVRNEEALLSAQVQ